MKLEAHLHVMGRVGPFTILTSEAVDSLAEKLSKPGEHVVAIRLPNGELVAATVVEGSVQAIDGLRISGQEPHRMVVMQVELDDGKLDEGQRLFLENAFPPPATGLEATEAERARAMGVLELQTEGGRVEPNAAA